MSIKDYHKKLIVINGLTNEQITVPTFSVDEQVFVPLTINEYSLFKIVRNELNDSDHGVTILSTYMKD